MLGKKFITVLAGVGLVLVGFAPTAQAAPTVVVQGGPFTGLDPAGADIHFGFGNFPTAHGLYILEAVKSADGTRPTVFNQATQVWVSTDSQAPAHPTGDVVLHVVGTFANADCSRDICGVFIRLDHTAPTDTSEDQFIPITFKAGVAGPALPADTISVKVNGVAVPANVPGTLVYGATAKFDVTTSSGGAISFKAYGPACGLNGSVVTALTGTGQCDIGVTSAGSSSFAGATSHYPFILAQAKQVLTFSTKYVKVGNSISLPTKTNLGEAISYSVISKTTCTYSKVGSTLKAVKVGNCSVKASAAGMSGNYRELLQKVSLSIKK